MITTIGLLIPIVIVFAIIFAGYKAFKNSERRGDEKLNLEKEQIFILKKQIGELNERVIEIEKILKDVK